jgi:hypothetical protein
LVTIHGSETHKTASVWLCFNDADLDQRPHARSSTVAGRDELGAGEARVRFFDVERERIWVFWRRVLHIAHHRTQLTVYLRLLIAKCPST